MAMTMLQRPTCGAKLSRMANTVWVILIPDLVPFAFIITPTLL